MLLIGHAAVDIYRQVWKTCRVIESHDKICHGGALHQWTLIQYLTMTLVVFPELTFPAFRPVAGRIGQRRRGQSIGTLCSNSCTILIILTVHTSPRVGVFGYLVRVVL